MNKLIQNGFLILDKPKKMTSREACVKVGKILCAKKAGNSGTLDPNATGALLICFDNATKIMPALQNLDKEYVAVAHMHRDVNNNEIESAIKKFTGTIVQTPPVRSAVARRPRKRKIYSIEILDRRERDVKLKIKCQAGTYIRKLISDIGNEIGGAHMKELRRIKVGDFSIEQAHTIDEIKHAAEKGDTKKIILPIEIAVSHLKKIIIKDGAVKSVCNGRPLRRNDILGEKDNECDASSNNIKAGELISLLTPDKKLVALARFVGNKTVARIERVIKISGEENA